MGGGPCVIIIHGTGVQSGAADLSKAAEASCLLVDYLVQDDDVTLAEADLQPIIDFHLDAEKKLAAMTKDLLKRNDELAAKYNR